MTFDFSFSEKNKMMLLRVVFVIILQVIFFHKPLYLSFQTPPRFVFMYVSKESIQTLICDFACRNDSLEEKKEKKKENLLVVLV